MYTQRGQPISPMVNGKYFTVDSALLLEQLFPKAYQKQSSRHFYSKLKSSLENGNACACLKIGTNLS